MIERKDYPAARTKRLRERSEWHAPVLHVVESQRREDAIHEFYAGVVNLPVGGRTLIFDGECGFCTAAARWVSKRWTKPARAVAWQQLGEQRLHDLGLTEWDVQHAAYWVDEQGGLARGHAAVARALVAGEGWIRVAGYLLLAPPLSWLARPGYWLVARYRHRLPGATDSCRL
jgi:predicted DCC family thiol-disulfide oxidoreductase YuxK